MAIRAVERAHLGRFSFFSLKKKKSSIRKGDWMKMGLGVRKAWEMSGIST